MDLPAWIGASAAVGAACVALTALRVQRVIARDQRLWDERKQLYIELLMEQADRKRSLDDLLSADLDEPATHTTLEFQRQHDMLSARRIAFSSRAVNDLEFACEIAARSYSGEIYRLRQSHPEQRFSPGAEDAALEAASKEWLQAEYRLIQQVHEELTHERRGPLRQLWRLATRRFRLPTAPDL